MNPKIFGWQHFTYVAIVLVFIIVGIIVSKKYVKTEKTQMLILKITSALLLIAILGNRISIVFKTSTPKWSCLIPDSFCGMSSLVLSLAILIGKKDNAILHFVWFAALLGGVITHIYPDFISQNSSFFYLPTITGLLHHTLSVVVVIEMFLFKYIYVTYKRWYCSLFGFTCYLTLGAFLISVLNYSDAFHIMSPMISGTPLTVWVIAPIYVLVYGTILFLFEIVRKRHNKTNNNQKQ